MTKLECVICNKFYANKNTLKAHNKRFHSNTNDETTKQNVDETPKSMDDNQIECSEQKQENIIDFSKDDLIKIIIELQEENKILKSMLRRRINPKPVNDTAIIVSGNNDTLATNTSQSNTNQFNANQSNNNINELLPDEKITPDNIDEMINKMLNVLVSIIYIRQSRKTHKY